ncbi:MAG: hypothetical protein QG553_282 [Patescibacteria group bacterium]|nr:hypothetical protein [Patescibacteria group bacterium]
MAERSLMVYSDSSGGLLEVENMYLRVDFGDEREHAHYAVGNIFELETWQRFDPTNDNLEPSKIRTLGSFGTLAELRDTYQSELERELERYESIETLVEAANEEPPFDFLESLAETPYSVKNAIHQAAIERFSAAAIELGADEAVIEQAQKIAEQDFENGESPEFVKRAEETHDRIIDRALWQLFEGSHEAADLLYASLDWFLACSEAPYTVYVTDEEVQANLRTTSPYHYPRVKINRQEALAAITDSLALLAEYDDDNTDFIEEDFLALARNIVASAEA